MKELEGLKNKSEEALLTEALQSLALPATSVTFKTSSFVLQQDPATARVTLSVSPIRPTSTRPCCPRSRSKSCLTNFRPEISSLS